MKKIINTETLTIKADNTSAFLNGIFRPNANEYTADSDSLEVIGAYVVSECKAVSQGKAVRFECAVELREETLYPLRNVFLEILFSESFELTGFHALRIFFALSHLLAVLRSLVSSSTPPIM